MDLTYIHTREISVSRKALRVRKVTATGDTKQLTTQGMLKRNNLSRITRRSRYSYPPYALLILWSSLVTTNIAKIMATSPKWNNNHPFGPNTTRINRVRVWVKKDNKLSPQ